jgi:hypothetical protein
MMTRKHFKTTAVSLRSIKSWSDRMRAATLAAEKFAKENPRFNKDKFFTACDL